MTAPITTPAVAERRWTDAAVGDLVDLAWDAGRFFERERIAMAQAELDATWRPVGRRGHEQLIAERVAAMESCAARQGWNTWHGQYPGGPVDYDTGRLRAALTAAGRAA